MPLLIMSQKENEDEWKVLNIFTHTSDLDDKHANKVLTGWHDYFGSKRTIRLVAT